MKRAVLTIFVFLITAVLPVAVLAQQPAGPKLNWQAVAGARQYLVEIKNAEWQTVLKQETPYNFLPLRLPPGDYSVRITVYNAFNKPASSSDWMRVVIRRSAQPQFYGINPQRLVRNDTQTIVIQGAGFAENMTVVIKDNQGRPLALNDLQRFEDSLIRFSVSTKGLNAGTYSLHLTNPGHEATVVTDALVITKRPHLRILRIEPSSAFVRDMTPLKFLIEGKGFTDNLEVTLRRGETEITPKPQDITPRSFKLVMLGTDNLYGTWDMYLKQGETLYLEKKSALSIDALAYGFFGLGPLDVWLGLSLTTISGNWAERFPEKTLTPEIGLSVRPRLFIDNSPFWLNLFGAYTSFSARNLQREADTTVAKSELGQLFFYGGLFVEYPVFTGRYLQLEPVLGLGAGFSRSTLTVEGKQSITSMDPVLEGWAGLRFTTFDYYYLEPGARFRQIMYIDQAQSSWEITLKAGFRM